jgi:hypothetical protein
MNAKLSLILREKMRKWMKEVMMKKKKIINREKSMNAKLSLILRGKRRKWMKGEMMNETS